DDGDGLVELPLAALAHDRAALAGRHDLDASLDRRALPGGEAVEEILRGLAEPALDDLDRARRVAVRVAPGGRAGELPPRVLEEALVARDPGVDVDEARVLALHPRAHVRGALRI